MDERSFYQGKLVPDTTIPTMRSEEGHPIRHGPTEM